MTVDLVHNAYVRAMDEQFSLYEWFARQYGLQHKSMQILFWVKNFPKRTGRLMTQKEIAQKTYSSKQVVNATIKSWEAKGYVELLENSGDKRQKLVKLTKTGEAFATQIYRQLSQMEAKATAGLTEEEQKVLNSLTVRYNAVLRAEMERLHDSI
ncbi:MAG: MarR family transcriptional regulator [Eubacteriales bacterium]|nr:MarR family transcriptional regulator [Eubacteriales bacterium]